MSWRAFAISIILSVYVALALAYSIIIPLGEASDEVPHFSYIQALAITRQMPKAEGQVSGESHQPPLYYILGALATSWIPQRGFQVIANPDFALDDRHIPNLLVHNSREQFPYHEDVLAWHLARLVSIALGAVTLWATWKIAREIFSDNAALALGATVLVAFLPSFVALSAVVNNDNLIIALSALSILQVVRMRHRGIDTRGAIALGILLGLGALTKLSGFVVWIFAALALVPTARKTGNWKALVFPVGLCYGIAGAMIAPWFIYNIFSFGDPLGWSVILATTPIRTEPMTWQEARGIAQGLFTSFWGRFGGALHIHMTDWIYAVLGIFALIGLGGWVGYARDAQAKRLTASVRESLVLFLLFWAVMLIAYVRWSFVVLGADQARQLFPGLPLIAVFFATGWARLLGTRQMIGFTAGAVGLLVINLGTLVYLSALFGGT